jgi:hypothetical protein
MAGWPATLTKTVRGAFSAAAVPARSHRVVRAVTSLAAVLAAYAAYAMVAVPLIDPRVERTESVSLEQVAEPGSLQRYEAQLRRWFGPDSWVHDHPKLLESDRGMLLVRQYEPRPDGTIELRPFAMVVFPHEAARLDPARAGEALVLEAPRGVLRFEKGLDLRRAKVGPLKTGELLGPVTIRSDQQSPSPDDDLVLTTENVHLSSQRVWTTAMVRFRHGPHHGQGRELIIRLVPGQQDSASRSPVAVGGVGLIELVHDVQMHFQLKLDGLLPGPTAKAAAGPPVAAGAAAAAAAGPTTAAAGRPGNASAVTAPPPPVEITSRGPFRFDLRSYEATFEDQVDVMRLHPTGQSDHLSCELLTIQFVPRGPSKPDRSPAAHRAARPASPSGAAAPAPTAASTAADAASSAAGAGSDVAASPDGNGSLRALGALEPRRLTARGNPVIVRAASVGASAQCQQLEYDIPSGKVTLIDRERVMLRYRTHEVHAPRVTYRPDRSGGLGLLDATGPGRIVGALPGQSGRFEARWQKYLQLRPHEGRQLLALVGQVQLDHGTAGRLSADEVWLWLLESLDSGSSTAARRSQSPLGSSRLSPDRMLATGSVRIDSPRISGETERFEVWFFPPVGNVAGGNDAGGEVAGGEVAGGDAGGGNVIGHSLEPGAGELVDRHDSADPGAGGFTDPRRRGGALHPDERFPGPMRPVSRTAPTERSSHLVVSGKLLRINVRLIPWSWAVSDLHVSEDARLVETRTARPEDVPLAIDGDVIDARAADGPDARLAIAGRPARLRARGMSLSGARVNMTRRDNRVWIDGPGKMTVPWSGRLQSLDVAGAGRPTPPGALPHADPSAAASAAAAAAAAPALRTLGGGESIEVTWQGGMAFDGTTIRFTDRVEARGQTLRLKTEELAVRLAQRIDFSAPPKLGDRVQPGQLICRHGAWMLVQSYDEQGLASVMQLETQDLSLDQRSGDVSAAGPGWLRAVHRGGSERTQMITTAAPPAAAGSMSPAAMPSAAARLSYLHVQFARGITGNLHQRQLAFADQVHALYGPVDDWDQSLAVDAAGRLPPGVVAIRCDELIVAQSPTARRGEPPGSELTALGSAVAEGAAFTARAHRMAYAEAKDLLILEGSGREPARLWRHAAGQGPTADAEAQRILYWPRTQRLEADGFRSLQIDRLGR